MSRAAQERNRLRRGAARLAGELVYLHGFRGTAKDARDAVKARWPTLSEGAVSAVVRELTFGETDGITLPACRPRTYGRPRR